MQKSSGRRLELTTANAYDNYDSTVNDRDEGIGRKMFSR